MSATIRSWSVVGAALVAAAAMAADGTSAPEARVRVAQRFVKNGAVVEFSLTRSDESGSTAPLMEGDWADATFRISDAATGRPLTGLYPAAWMDVAADASTRADQACRDRVALYLKGIVGVRPLVDLNSYHLLVLNRDASISVIDPVVSMTGKTSLYASILLQKPGADWVASADGKRLYVSMPRAGAVAVVDTDTFKVRTSVPAGAEPTRLVLQQDGRYLWVGNDARDPGASGVTVVDTERLEAVAHIATGAGHHEIAVSPDDRRAFVTNRGAQTVTVIDVQKLSRVKDLPGGAVPISVATSTLSRSVYVADGSGGTIRVIDPQRVDTVAQIAVKPGLGPLRFSPDGRWGLVVNTTENMVHVIDAAENRVVQDVPVPGQPYQVTFTRGFAYVRLLDSERVALVNLLSLGEGKAATVQTFEAGQSAPKLGGELGLADTVTPAAKDAAVFVVSPGDGTTFFYMEGMNAPMGSYGSYGHAVLAARVVDRSLREVEPGRYVGKLRIPVAGEYDIAFLVESPTLVTCFSASAASNPQLKEPERAVAVEWLPAVPGGRASDPGPIRFRLADPATRRPRAGLSDVRVLSYLAPGHDRVEVSAVDTGGGVYEASPRMARPGAYYVYVAVPSLGMRYGDLPYRTMTLSTSRGD